MASSLKVQVAWYHLALHFCEPVLCAGLDAAALAMQQECCGRCSIYICKCQAVLAWSWCEKDMSQLLRVQ